MLRDKRILCLIVILGILAGIVPARFSVQGATLSDGTYIVPVKLYQSSSNSESIGNSAFHQEAKVIVESGKTTVYVKFQSMSMLGMDGYLMELNELQNISFNANNYPSSYTTKATKVISTFDVEDSYNGSSSTDNRCKGKKYPKVVSFSQSSMEMYTWMQVYVPVMGTFGAGEQLCRVRLDYGNATPISEAQETQWDTYMDVSQDNNQDQGQSTAATTTTTSTTATTAATTTEDEETTTSNNLDKDKLDNGKYKVSVYLWHANSNQASMGNAALNHEALITVKNGSYQMDISTRPMQVGTITACLKNLWIQQSGGSYKKAKITARNNTGNQPSVFSFAMPSKDTYIPVKIDPGVDVMGSDPIGARLRVDWSTLKQTSSTDTVTENNTVADSSSGSSSTSGDDQEDTDSFAWNEESEATQAAIGSGGVSQLMNSLDNLTLGQMISLAMLVCSMMISCAIVVAVIVFSNNQLKRRRHYGNVA